MKPMRFGNYVVAGMGLGIGFSIISLLEFLIIFFPLLAMLKP